MPAAKKQRDTAPPAQSRGAEWVFVLFWVAVIVVVVAGPIWHGYSQNAENRQFLGFVGVHRNDCHAYLAWIRQAYDGHVLFRDNYTSEPHARSIFLPLFLAMGWFARLTGVPVMSVWQVTHVAGCAAVVVAVYWLAREVIADSLTRLLAVALVTSASGFGWMVSVAAKTPFPERPIDLWKPVSGAFHAMTISSLTLPIALALMLACMAQALRYFRTGNMREAVIGGIFALLLASIHLYDVVTLFLVLGTWTLLAGRRYYLGMAMVVAMALPYCIYSAVTLRLDPVLSQMTWEMAVPTINAHLVGWGLPALLAAAALAIPAIWRENPRVGYLGIWLAISVLLPLVPIGFQTKLIWGASVAMGLLAAIFTTWLVRATIGPHGTRRSGIAWAAAVGIAVVGFSAVGSYRFYDGLFERNAERVIGDYFPPSVSEAMEWLADRTEEGDVAIAGPGIDALLPGRAGVTVFRGHWAQTLDNKRKIKFVFSLLCQPNQIGDELVERVFQRNRVRFVVLDGLSMQRYRVPPADQKVLVRSAVNRWTPVLKLDGIMILEVKDYQRQSNATPWESGDWLGP